MKKFILSLIAIVFGMSLVTTAQIPNSGFEDWTAGNPDNWATSNVFEAGLVTITQTSDMYSGASAVKGDVVSFLGTPMAPIIQSGHDATGFAISEQYRMFELYYKFTSVGGDKFSVNVGFEKNGNPIAQGAVAIPDNIGVYTHLSVPMNYMIDDIPDHANIQISITGPVTGPDVHLGSVMFIDELSFSFAMGIAHPSAPGFVAECFPNPASDVINIRFNDDIRGEVVLKIFDIFGKEVKSLSVPQQQAGNSSCKLSTADLPSGLYFYRVIGQGGHYTGKFNINR